MTDTMRALLLGRGPEWVLDEVPIPTPGPGQVLIGNRASTFAEYLVTDHRRGWRFGPAR